MALISTGEVKGASEAAGCSERHVRDRLSDPGFRQQYAAARSEVLREGVARLQGAVTSAVGVLTEGLHSESERYRMEAARAILNNVDRLTNTVELSERVAALEKAVSGSDEESGK